MNELTKEELRRLRKATEGRAYMTKQLYETIQKIFRWLDDVAPVGLEVDFDERGTNMLHTISKKLDPTTMSSHWYYDGVDILVSYEGWQNKIMGNPLIASLSREQIMTIARNIDIIIGNIRLQLEDDVAELQKALNFVQETIQNEVKD